MGSDRRFVDEALRFVFLRILVLRAGQLALEPDAVVAALISPNFFETRPQRALVD